MEETGEHDEAIRHTGRIIKLIDRAQQRVLGIFRALPGGGGRLVPIDKKQVGRELAVPPGAGGDAQDGDLVAVEVAQRSGRFGLATARVTEKLGSLKSERAVSLIAIHAHAIPHVFRATRWREAEAAKPATLAGREDWRELPLITIDPADAKDHDDAVHATPDADPKNPGGFVDHGRDRRRRALCDGLAPRSTAKRWCAATRSISPTGSCRCCRSASPTICARCGRTRIAPRSRCAWSSVPTGASAPTASIAC